MDFLSKIKKLKPVFFEWKKDVPPRFHFKDEPEAGLIAQEVEEVFPELVVTNPDGYKAIRYGWIPMYLLQAIQEQQKLIEELQKKIDELSRLGQDLG